MGSLLKMVLDLLFRKLVTSATMNRLTIIVWLATQQVNYPLQLTGTKMLFILRWFLWRLSIHSSLLECILQTSGGCIHRIFKPWRLSWGWWLQVSRCQDQCRIYEVRLTFINVLSTDYRSIFLIPPSSSWVHTSKCAPETIRFSDFGEDNSL